MLIAINTNRIKRMKIQDLTFSNERALYHLQDAVVENCRFEGEEDGESALKESRQITVNRCYFDLRYPLWHVNQLTMTDCEQTERCRAALWYSDRLAIKDCVLGGIKALRECKNIQLTDCRVNSPEFGWRCKDIEVRGGNIAGEYAFFEDRNLTIEDLDFSGKYAFQYVENLQISHSRLTTKDAFWHAKGATITDSEVTGEYLGWYSESLTFIRCHIKGTQPLCYCKNLTLIDCTMENCDLSFEYSEVQADVHGEILSVKNPRSGKILADSYGEIILTDSVYPLRAQILQR